jgi:hypothetical protein
MRLAPPYVADHATWQIATWQLLREIYLGNTLLAIDKIVRHHLITPGCDWPGEFPTWRGEGVISFRRDARERIGAQLIRQTVLGRCGNIGPAGDHRPGRQSERTYQPVAAVRIHRGLSRRRPRMLINEERR